MSDFKFSAVRTENHSKVFKNEDAWTVRVTNPRGKTFQRKFYMGSGHKGVAPTLEDFMFAVISDADSYEGARDAGDFMAEYGYEEYSHALRAYNACQRTAVALSSFLTAEERARFREE